MHRLVLRERLLTWGATAEESKRDMPGDGLMPEPDPPATRAITVEAPPAGDLALAGADGRRGGSYREDGVTRLVSRNGISNA